MQKDLTFSKDKVLQPILVVLLGPTGVGKTELSLQMASHLAQLEAGDTQQVVAAPLPIFNCDSRQLYKGIEIGTAAPTAEQMARVKHYFVGTLQLDDYYSAARYEEDVMQKLSEHFSHHSIALLTGGSMLYLDAVCKGIDDIPTIPETLRKELKDRLVAEGLPSLFEELKRLDPEYAAIVDPHNTRRVLHALEICLHSGLPYSTFRKEAPFSKPKERPFHIIKIGLNRPRPELFERINCRVDEMMKQGLLEEVRRHLPQRRLNALNTVGFKELFSYLDGTMDYETSVERIKKNTRVYAKKQLTWFAHDASIQWFHPDDKEAIFCYIEQEVRRLSR